jgi:hypothetical protein
METELIEVASGTLTTPDGQKHQIQGGAYLTPEAYLQAQGELERLRQAQLDAAASKALPTLMIGAGLVGFALGFWLARSGDDD